MLSLRVKKIIMLLMTLLVIGFCLVLGEIYCRLFTDINFLDNSREMFTANRFGDSYGNTPNFSGVSFGEKFTTDTDGFRYDPDFKETAPAGGPALMVIGDSVTFGPAVVESETVAGILRRSSPGYELYNASAIGYDTHDYEAVVSKTIAGKPGIKKVLLFFCLNDVNNVSAQQIRKTTNAGANQPDPAAGSFFQPVNDYLRSRSKLYLLLKNLARDTRMIYFKNDLTQYQQGQAYAENALAPLAEIKKTLDSKKIDFEVFVLPYEAQVRPETPPEYLQPQQLVDDYLQKNNIPYRDLTPAFQNRPDENRLFLYGDPMHLSSAGNRLAANAVCAELKDICKIN